MKLAEITQKFISVIHDRNIVPYNSDGWIEVYSNIFGVLPNCTLITALSKTDRNDDWAAEKYRKCNYQSAQAFKYDDNCIDGKGSVFNIADKCTLPFVKFSENFSLCLLFDGIIIAGETIYYKDKIPEEFYDLLILKETTNYVKYVIHGRDGFSSTAMDIKGIDFNTDYYNDDIPDEKIQNFIKSDESGVAIFNGPPGTGKSYYLRSLIKRNPSVPFLYVDASVFNYITDAGLISLLWEYKGAVLIVEDCENMLKDRLNDNQSLSSLLNLSDGIIGDGLHLKFICTFNAPLSKIDSAILRKGRLKVKYTFDKLNAEKANIISKQLNRNKTYQSPVELCNILNEDENIINEDSSRVRKIGFDV